MKLTTGPRERIKKYGIQSLEDYELIAILLKTGSLDKNVIELSKDILDEIISLKTLNDYKYEEFLKFKGIGDAKAMTLCAALELSNRIKKIDHNIKTIRTVYDEILLLKDDFYNLSKERLIIVFLDSSLKVLSKQLMQEGRQDSVVIDVKEILKRALKLNSTIIITAHNHPSGQEEPSNGDIKAYNALERKMKEFEIDIFDHLIFTNETYLSIKYGKKPKSLKNL